MKRNRFQQPDSTGLLLDTVCNTFGGIILIALLVALLARDVQSESKLDINPDARMELLQRRLDRAGTERDRGRKKIEALETQLNVFGDSQYRDLTEQITASRKELAELREQYRDHRTELDVFLESGTGDLLQVLINRKAEMITELDAEKNQSLVLQGTLEQKQQQKNELHERLRNEREKRTARLRLPMEHKTRRTQNWVLVRYGRIYPTDFFRNGVKSLNRTTIKWTEVVQGRKADPIPDRGIDPVDNPEQWNKYLNQIDRRSYFLAFVVWPDSYAAFNQVKEISVEKGFEYAFDPYQAGEIILFSSEGYVPNPQ